MATYSFLDVTASISGIGGNFSLSPSGGNADEGITAEYVEDKNAMMIGAGGDVMHSLRASMAGMVVVRLLKTSKVNNSLSKLFSSQRVSSANWGQNTILVQDLARGDTYTATQVAFKRHAPVTWGKDGNTMEWNFDAGWIDPYLGLGVSDVNVAA